MAGVITYYAYDMGLGYNTGVPVLEAELPLTGVTWSQRLNGVGSLTATIEVSDPRFRAADPWSATRPNRTILVVDIDGSIQWAGIIWTRSYQRSQRKLQIGAQEVWSYFANRLQAKDYTVPPTSGAGFAYWTSNPADPAKVAAAVIADAVASAGSALSDLTINVNDSTAFPNANKYSPSYPLAQYQTPAQIVADLAGGPYGTGFDFAIDTGWSSQPGSTPVFTLNLNYPRRGRPAGSTGLVLDVTPTTDYTWPEDGTRQANSIIENLTSASSGSTSLQVSDPTPLSAGYPLLEAVCSSKNINTSAQGSLAAKNDLALLEWPVVTPSFTAPMFGSMLPIGSFIMGDDIRIIIPPDERFTTGVDTYMRLIGLDAASPEQGLGTMTLTFNALPAVAPVQQLPV